MKHCQAVTQASSYTLAHPCLKKNGLKKVGKRYLCAHHRTAKPAPKVPVGAS